MSRLGKLFGAGAGNDGPAASPSRPESADGAPAAEELTEFAPRQDGDYHCVERGLFLRFARPSVTESADGAGTAASGEFTESGRFTVQRPFERPVTFTVLGRFQPSDGELTVRRTDTGTRESAVVTYVFEPDN